MHIHIPEPLSKTVRILAGKNQRTPTGEVVHAVRKHVAAEFVPTPRRKSGKSK